LRETIGFTKAWSLPKTLSVKAIRDRILYNLILFVLLITAALYFWAS